MKPFRILLLVAIFILVPFQNCSKVSTAVPSTTTEFASIDNSELDQTFNSELDQTSTPSMIPLSNLGVPKFLVNHDLYVHTDRGLENGNTKASSYVLNYNDSNAVPAAVNSVIGNLNDLSILGAALSLNATYGAHNLWYWPESTPIAPVPSYSKWVEDLFPSQVDYLNNGAKDTLILSKLKGQANFLSQVLNAKPQSQPLIISIRMNDHHHLIDADDFLNPNTSPLATDAYTSRKVAALTPEYLNFLKDGSVISGELNPPRGKHGAGLGCDKKDSEGKFSYHLDYSDDAVVRQKALEISQLLESRSDIDGIELDFMRSNCFFASNTTPGFRTSRMNLLFRLVLAAKKKYQDSNSKKLLLTFRVPLDESAELVHGIPVQTLAQDPNIDGIIFGFSKPYLRSQIVPHGIATKHSGLRLYFELYQISDNQSRRRPASKEEILTSAYDALKSGYNGISLFNMHYAFKDNPFLSQGNEARAFSWRSILYELESMERLADIKPTYFFNMRNANGTFKPRALEESASVLFISAQTGRNLSEKASLRIICERLAPTDEAAWKNVEFHVEINQTLVKSPNGLAAVPQPSTDYRRDPIQYYKISETSDWRPSASKDLMIPKTMFKNMSNRLTITIKKDPDNFMKLKGCPIQMHLAM